MGSEIPKEKKIYSALWWSMGRSFTAPIPHLTRAAVKSNKIEKVAFGNKE